MIHWRQRAAAAALTLGTAVLACFWLGQLVPGDALSSLALDATISPAVLASLRARYLPQLSLAARLRAWLWAALHGDLGYSLQYHRPVLSLLQERLGSSLQIMTLGLAAAWIFGLALSLLPACLGERGCRQAHRLGTAVSALVASLLAALPIGVLAIFAMVGLPSVFRSSISSPWLPSLVLALVFLPTVYFQAAHAVANQLHLPYIWQARAGGVPPLRRVFRHALPNTSDVLVPIASLTFSQALLELVIVENLTGWPGIGQLALRASLGHDMPLVAAVVLITSLLVVLANLASDLLQALLNPRFHRAGQFDSPAVMSQGAL